MCLIVFSYKQHPTYDLIFAANRDEFYERPTRAARFWEEHPYILAGKDLEAGGTWMGITKGGAFSALTNYRDISITKDNPPSRGHLVLDYLIENGDPESYLQKVDKEADLYNGFNLLAGTADKLMYYSNQEQNIRRLSPGLYGLSNHLLNTPWHKVEQAKKDMQRIISQPEMTEKELFEVLRNDVRAPDEALPSTGLSLELERAVSSVFIKTDNYGTRGSTVLLIDKEGQATFTERLYGPEARGGIETNRFEFKIEA